MLSPFRNHGRTQKHPGFLLCIQANNAPVSTHQECASYRTQAHLPRLNLFRIKIVKRRSNRTDIR